MNIGYHLLIHNIVCIFALISTLGLGTLVLIKDHKRTIYVVFALLNFSVGFFYLSHLLGVNATTAEEAYEFFKYNWLNTAMVIFTAHLLFETIGESKKHKFGIWMTYITGFGLIGYYILFPDALLKMPVPKMYMPFYYVPGDFYTVMRIYVLAIPTYSCYYFFKAFIKSKGGEHVRMKYIAAALLFGYGIGTTSILPIYDVYFDPIISMLFGFYTLFLAYGIIEFETFNIKVVGKRAIVYGCFVATTSVLIVLINTINSIIIENYKGFPLWVLPLLSSFIAVGIGTFIWSRVKEVDVAKYEFITIVTHKFRTPLTSIKWSAEILESQNSTEVDKQEAVRAIKHSEVVLSELIETLVKAYRTDNEPYAYVNQKCDFKQIIDEVLAERRDLISEKMAKISFVSEPNLPPIFLDKDRISFVIQTIIDNAINYSPKGKIITIEVNREKNSIVSKIKDEGIGISKEELPHIFSKFYRGNAAKRADTEGLGIGLSLAHQIVERHGGELSVRSDGIGQGTEFTLRLPIT
jgi:signal transduction histidine kinase